MVLQGLASVIGMEADLQIVGTARDGQTALTQIQALKPDIVILDIQLPDLPGSSLIHRIRQGSPAVRILMLTAHEDPVYLKQAWAGGADGYLLKHSMPEQLLMAIRLVMGGKRYVAPTLLDSALDDYRQLLQEERRREFNLTREDVYLLRLIVDGRSYREIAHCLHYSEVTVKRRARALYTKLGAAHRSQAVAVTLHLGLV